jgi:hypothetical protein
LLFTQHTAQIHFFSGQNPYQFSNGADRGRNILICVFN